MFNTIREEMEWGGRPLILETGKVARQADGAVMVSYGETVVLCTVVGAKTPKADVDFFPLTINYQVKAFAAGRIPGGYFKREGKPPEQEVLTSRLIDRPLRPLFPSHFHNEVQIICTTLSYDFESNPDVVALIGASAALAISGIPFAGPVGAARVGYTGTDYILNPRLSQQPSMQLDLVVAGTHEGVLMVESEAHELSEDIMLGAVSFGHEAMQPVIQMIQKLAQKVGKPTWAPPPVDELFVNLKETVEKTAAADIKAAYQISKKQERYHALQLIEDRLLEITEHKKQMLHAFEEVKYETLRQDVLNGHRVDGRVLDQVRPIVAEVGVLPRPHGSALFTRGETQALVVTTLGGDQDEQSIDALEGNYKERFMVHQNFPPFSVGEVGRMSGPGRREIGHGKLACRALKPLLPTKAQFPYAMRVVGEVTESNGSSSMAVVCGGSLALMAAGVPIPRPVAGIAMGLVKEGKKYAILSDILGDEDHLGDMDFKVAGTGEGITALQMDIKITSITPSIMKEALAQARVGRLHILGEMAKALPAACDTVSPYAPRMTSLQINKDKIRDVIGPGGKVIREICETTKARIDIAEDGKVTIDAPNDEALQKALSAVQAITTPTDVGDIITGTISRLLDFGAIVTFGANKEGLIHISELAPKRVEKVEDVVHVGQSVTVKVVGVDKGRLRLSLKAMG